MAKSEKKIIHVFNWEEDCHDLPGDFGGNTHRGIR